MKHILESILQEPDFAEGANWQIKRFAAKAEIIKQGEISRSFYLVNQGMVRVVGKVDIGEQRQVSPGVCDLSAGEVFGELVLFDSEPRSATVVAVTDCELYVIDGDRFMNFLEKNPLIGFRFLQELTAALVQRLRKTNNKIFSLLAWGLKAHNIDGHL